jgi:adenosine kinase
VFRDVSDTSGSLLIAGSIATDHLMSFGGKFADSLVV